MGVMAKKTNCAVSSDANIKNSLIDGPICKTGDSTLLNNRDKQKRPIPNQ